MTVGNVLQVSEELVHKYKFGSKEDKQVANKAVIDLVLHGLRGCTIQAKDVQTLHLFRALRRLFVPKGTRLSVAHNVSLTQVPRTLSPLSAAVGVHALKLALHARRCDARTRVCVCVPAFLYSHDLQ